MKRIALTALVLTVLCAAAVAQPPAEVQKYDLRYDPKGELVTIQQVNAKIDEVAMENNPLGIDGWMKGTLQHSATVLDPDKQSFVMTLQMEDIKQEFNGQPIGGETESQISVELTPLGQVKRPERAVEADVPTMAFAVGVPTQLLALLCHLVMFPDHPVAIGEEWTTEGLVDIGRDEPVPVHIATELQQVEQEQLAILLSDMDLRLARFKAPNPLGSGDPVDVDNGRMTISELSRVFDMNNGVVVQAEGKVNFSGQMDMSGFPLNIQVSLSFALTPQAPQEEQPIVAAAPAG
jgi:hypothetical protein